MNTLLKPLVFILFSCLLFACKREVITKEPTLEDMQKKLTGAWNVKYLEQELYVGGVMTSKKLITYNSSSISYKSDFTYTSIYESQAPETGTWELVSNLYLRLDKGKPNDRYYHISGLDEKTLVYRGPFDANGNAKFNYLSNVYNFK